MEIMEGRRKGSVVYVEDNYGYRVNHKRIDKLYASCIKTKTCNGRGIIENNHVTITNEHNHGPDPDYIDSIRFVSVCKKRAEKSAGKLKDIFSEESKRYKNTRINFSTLQSVMRKRRSHNIPAPPKDLSEFYRMLPETPYKLARSGQPFFSARIEVNDSVTVVFISPSISSNIGELTEIQIGLNAHVVPAFFNYFCVIHAVTHHVAFPFVYALMTGQSLGEFNLLFQHVSNVLPNLNPLHICTDYNSDLQASCSRVFPKAVVSGSYYFYAQEVWQQSTSLGLQPSYRNREPSRKIIGMCLALALLPSHLLEQGLEVIRDQIAELLDNEPLQQKLYALSDYMEKEWLSRGTQVSVFGQENRTSNYVHVFHILLKKKFGRVTPMIWVFLDRLKDIEEQKRKDFERMQQGKYTKRPRRQPYILGERAISQAGDKLLRGKCSVPDYLESVAKALPEPTDDEIFGLDDWVAETIECKDMNSFQVAISNESFENAPTVYVVQQGGQNVGEHSYQMTVSHVEEQDLNQSEEIHLVESDSD